MKLPKNSSAVRTAGLTLTLGALVAGCEWFLVTTYPNPVFSGMLASSTPFAVSPVDSAWARLSFTTNWDTELECLTLSGARIGSVALSDAKHEMADDPSSNRWWVATDEGTSITITRYSTNCVRQQELTVPAPSGTVYNAYLRGIDVDSSGVVYVSVFWDMTPPGVVGPNATLIHKYDLGVWSSADAPEFPTNLGIVNHAKLRYDAGTDNLVLGANMTNVTGTTPVQLVVDATTMIHEDTRIFPSSWSGWSDWDVWGNETIANFSTGLGSPIKTYAYTANAVPDPEWTPILGNAKVWFDRPTYVGPNGYQSIDLWIRGFGGDLKHYRLE